MKMRAIGAVLLAGFLSLSAYAGFEQFSDPAGGMWVTPQNGDPAFGIYPFGLNALQSITSDNRTFELIPNVNLYEDSPGDSVWRNNGGAGPDGNSILISSTTFEIASITPDLTSAVFDFNVDAYDLNARYTVQGYIKVLNPATGYSVTDSQIITISSFGLKQLQLPISGSYTGQILQVGWDLTGLNANPADDWGSATFTVSNLYVLSSDTTAPTPDPMEFSVAPLAISSNAISMTASADDDNYDVEYLFTNITANTGSEWQSSPSWVDNGPQLAPVTNAVELMSDPTYLNLNGNWEGYAGGAQVPSTFVSVSAGVATVTPGSATEWNFYQTFGAGPAGNPALTLGQPYTFSIVSDNDTTVGTSSAVAFVKAFDAGWGFLGGEFKSVALAMDGSPTTISFTPVAGAYYQVGTFTVGTTSGSYDVSDPSLVTTNITPASSGLTPDSEYFYKVKARDLSPQTNETAWSAAVAGTSTVFDVTAPTPDPMLFFEAPNALGDTVISMTASNATDDAFGVEYLFSNVVNNSSSGWQSSPTWVEGNIVISNADFEAGGEGFEFNSGGVASATTTNISGNTSALITSDGGWAVVVKAITNLAAAGFNAGDTVTVSADVKALAGKNGGGAGFKVESWGGGSFISDSGEISISPTESWDNYSIDYTIDAGADEIRVVLLVVAGSDSEYLFDNLAVFSGSSLSPGTEYTYMVKARDTSPNNNETAWSASASATTTGLSPVPPAFGIDTAEIVAGVGAIFSWEGTAGYTYGVEYSTNLVTGPWIPDPSLGALDILSAGGTMSATSTVDNASVFFRIIAE